MPSIGELYTHNPYFGRRIPVASMTEVNEGDVLSFVYDGKQRWVFVLNPNYENKMHCLALEKMPRRVLLGEVVSFNDVKLNGGEGPKAFYEKTVGNKPVNSFDAYRTFIIEKMSKMEKVEYVVNQVSWVQPNLTAHAGALALAAQRFGIDPQTLIDQARTGNLIQWPDPAWARLKNSASFRIPLNGFYEITRMFGGGVVDDELDSLQDAFRTGGEVSAPIVLFIGDNTEETPYLVSGEIKMMYSRAAGVLPRVWLVTLPSADNKVL